tara:strand:+ start:142 stop:471 length:330 start_codon:yes stop_codon:yes gene_type:complete
MKILDAIIGGIGDRMGQIGDNLMDPMGMIGDAINDNEFLALMQDPKNFEQFMLNQINDPQNKVRRRNRRSNQIPQLGMNSQMPAMQGGFINQMPNYLNTDQLILGSLLG